MPSLPLLATGSAALAALVALAFVALMSGNFSIGSDATTSNSPRDLELASAATEPARSATAAVAAASDRLPLPFDQHEDYREYTPAQLREAGFIDTGAFIVIPLNPLPVAYSSYRAGFTALQITEAGFVDLGPDGWHRGMRPDQAWSSVSAVGLTATVEGVKLYAVFSAQRGLRGPTAMTQLLAVGGDGLAFYSINDQKPEVILDVTTDSFEQIPAVVDIRGHVWVRLDPISEGPLASDTGELPNITNATTFGPLPAGVGNWQNLTWCEGGPCTATLHLHTGGGLAAVSEGRATCTRGDTLTIELTTATFRLRFIGATPNAMSVPDREDGFPRDVAAGEMLSRHPSWEVSAFGPDGSQIGVASDRDRMLYVDVENSIDVCPPCYTGS